jgi:hypothetical protein
MFEEIDAISLNTCIKVNGSNLKGWLISLTILLAYLVLWARGSRAEQSRAFPVRMISHSRELRWPPDPLEFFFGWFQLLTPPDPALCIVVVVHQLKRLTDEKSRKTPKAVSSSRNIKTCFYL